MLDQQPSAALIAADGGELSNPARIARELSAVLDTSVAVAQLPVFLTHDVARLVRA